MTGWLTQFFASFFDGRRTRREERLKPAAPPPLPAKTTAEAFERFAFSIHDIRGATLTPAPEPPKKKPERHVPVLDDDYFDSRTVRYSPFLSASQYQHYGIGTAYGASWMPGVGSHYPRWP